MSKKIGETGMRRRSVPRTPPWLCAVSRCFGNRDHDCLDPRVSRSVVTNRCLANCQGRRYDTHVTHLGASASIKYRHMFAGGTAPLLQSRQVQISSKLHEGKCIGITCGFTSSPEVGPRANVGTLQTEYSHAQDLSLVSRRQTPHPVGKGSGVTACPRGSRPASGAGELWHRHVPCGTEHATRQGRALELP
jgi:hypothetical protein